jgi:hypothetical protein
VRGVNLNAVLGARFYPTMQDTSAWKDERMHTAPVYDGQDKITVEWCGCYSLPMHLEMIRPRFGLVVDPCQNPENSSEEP